MGWLPTKDYLRIELTILSAAILARAQNGSPASNPPTHTWGTRIGLELCSSIRMAGYGRSPLGETPTRDVIPGVGPGVWSFAFAAPPGGTQRRRGLELPLAPSCPRGSIRNFTSPIVTYYV